jgi:Ca2+-binding EF-hand superfamily protein
MNRRLLLSHFVVLMVGTSPIAVALAQTARETSFATADTNHDDHISPEEFEAFATARIVASDGFRARMFQQLSPQEQAARLKARFDSMDTEHKGYLDLGDWKPQS